LREAISYLKKLIEACVESVKHTCLYLEALVLTDPNDMTDCISYSTKVQQKFIEHPEFLFWRGRILLYNGQLEMGKKHLKQALQIDPDSLKIQRYWKNLQKGDKLKQEAAELFAKSEIEQALANYEQCLLLDPLNNAFNMTILYNQACALAKVD